MKKLCLEFVVAILGLIIGGVLSTQPALIILPSWGTKNETIHSIFIFTDLHRVKAVKMFSDTLFSLLVQTSPYHHCFRFGRFVLSSLQSSSPVFFSSLHLHLKRKWNRNLKHEARRVLNWKFHWFIFVFPPHNSRTLLTLILIKVKRCIF